MLMVKRGRRQPRKPTRKLQRSALQGYINDDPWMSPRYCLHAYRYIIAILSKLPKHYELSSHGLANLIDGQCYTHGCFIGRLPRNARPKWFHLAEVHVVSIQSGPEAFRRLCRLAYWRPIVLSV